MIDIYKVSIQSITETDKQQMLDAIGRAGEEITGRSSFQHIGFHSTPKQDSIGFLVADGDNLTMIASSDSAADRPDNLEDSTTIYRDKDKYIKIAKSGDVTVANKNNKLILNSDGSIEIGGDALATLKALCTEDILSTLQVHTHPVAGALASPSTDPAMLILSTDPGNKTVDTKVS